MRAYVMTTGALFGLLTLAHLLRIIQEGRHLATDPLYLLITVAAAALCLWAWRLLRHSARQ
jgi:protein-S-isoprenylcysteine O-methyltransferase Ste14